MRKKFSKKFSSSPTLLTTSFWWSFVAAMVALPGVVRTKITAVIFPLDDLALISQLSQFQTLIIVMGIGGFVTASKVVLSRHTIGEKERFPAQSWLLVVPVMISLFVAICCMPFTKQISALISGNPDNSIPVFFALIGLPAASISQQIIGFAQSNFETRRLIFAISLSSFISSGTTLALMSTRDITIGSVSFASAPIIQAMCLLLLIKTAQKNIFRKPKVTKETRNEVLIISLSSLPLGLSAAITELTIRSLVVAEYGLNSIAPYVPSVLIATQLFGLFIASVTTATMVQVSKSTIEKFAGIIENVQKTVIPIVSLTAAFLIGVGPLLVQLFFSSDLLPTSIPFLAISLSNEVLRATSWSLGSILLPMKDRKGWFLIGMTTVFVNLIVAVALIPIIGAIAIPISTGVASGLSIIMICLRIRFLNIHVPFSALFVGPTLWAVTLASYFITNSQGLFIEIGPLILCLVLAIVYLHRQKRTTSNDLLQSTN